MTYRGSLSWLTAYRHLEARPAELNPENQVLRIPRHTGTSELRPNLKLTAGDLSLLLRPRIRFEVQEIEVNHEPEAVHGKASDEISEAYAQWALSESVTFAYGRQSYQWGAAESLSPSNRIFHDGAQAKNVLYDVKGRDMARVNFTAGKTFSLVMMSELKQNEDIAPFTAEEEFQTVGLLKPEISWNSGADYLGFVVGARELERGWIGEYFNLSLPIPEGLSLYGDASHERGSGAWYPEDRAVVGPAGPAEVVGFGHADANARDIRTLAVGGLRYDFEGGTVIRGEYIHNESGWTEEQREHALSALDRTSPLQAMLFEENLPRFMTPGFDVPGRRFAFASILAPDALSLKDLTLYLRATRSLTDDSTEVYGSMELKVGDAGTVLLASSATTGEDGSELRGYATPGQFVAYRHDW